MIIKKTIRYTNHQQDLTPPLRGWMSYHEGSAWSNPNIVVQKVPITPSPHVITIMFDVAGTFSLSSSKHGYPSYWSNTRYEQIAVQKEKNQYHWYLENTRTGKKE